MLDVVHLRIVERRIVEQNLDRVRAPIGDSLGGNMRQQIGQAAGLGIVVAALFIRQQQAGVGGARLRGGKAVFGIQQNRARVRRQNLRHRDLEFAHHLVRHLIRRHALGRRDGFLQAAALVHGGRRDHAVLVRERLHVAHFSFR